MILLQVSDFTGFSQLSKNTFTTPVIQAYIDRYEKQYIYQLLGVVLGDLFITSIGNASVDERFVKIRDEFDFDYNFTQYHSRGMKEILKNLVLYNFVSTTQSGHSTTGVFGSVNEAQTNKTDSDAARWGEIRWNDVLDDITALQWYCKTYALQLYPNDPTLQYPEYNGQEFTPRFSPLL